MDTPGIPGGTEGKRASLMGTTDQPANNGTAGTRPPSVETLRVQGEELAAKVKELLHESNVRRITVRNEQGHAVMEIPVTAGVVAANVAPGVVAVAAIAALAGSWEIDVDRTAVLLTSPKHVDPTPPVATT
jgi:hypothetical protein